MTILSQEPAEIVNKETAVSYPKRNSYQTYLFLKWKRGLLYLMAIFLIGQLFSFGVHVSMAKWDIDEHIEDVLGENIANVVRWLGSEGRAWSVFLDESGLKDTVYQSVGVVQEEIEEIVDPFVWFDPWTW
ncbi:hypothetical protein KAR91_87330 [Candidatus Pacearchaeota archaeon]|nr:hypothetical protein [Candidatus Pacearchaeota archaeon]